MVGLLIKSWSPPIAECFAGAAWKSEYGDPSVPTDFDFMYPLSPVHNVPTGRVLPAIMLMVSPGQSIPVFQLS